MMSKKTKSRPKKPSGPPSLMRYTAPNCPYCDSEETFVQSVALTEQTETNERRVHFCKCRKCGFTWQGTSNRPRVPISDAASEGQATAEEGDDLDEEDPGAA